MRQKGFTLVEFAISSLITMVLLGATFTLMNSVFTANEGMGDIMAAQANVRVALNTIARDITMAGTGLPAGSVEVPNGPSAVAIVRPGMSDSTSAGRFVETPNNALPFLSPGDGAGTTVSAPTDTLTIFSVNQETPTWTVASVALFSNRYEITFTQPVDSGANVLVPGDLLLFNNSQGSVLASVTALSSSNTATALFGDADVMGINQPTAEGGNLSSLSSTNPATTAYPPTTAMKINLINYFVSTATGRPRLMRAVNNSDAATAQVISDDIENLQFSFDLFDYNTAVQTSDVGATTSPNQIRAVLVALTGRSAEVLKRTSNYYRFQLVSKINIRNATFRNRYAGN
jgi:Tfp pilus assembly protein PilW